MSLRMTYTDALPLSEMLKCLVELSGRVQIEDLSYPPEPVLPLCLRQFFRSAALAGLPQLIQIHHEAIRPLPLLLRESVPRLDHLLSKGIRLVAIEQTGVHEDVHPQHATNVAPIVLRLVQRFNHLWTLIKQSASVDELPP